MYNAYGNKSYRTLEFSFMPMNIYFIRKRSGSRKELVVILSLLMRLS